MIEMLAGSRVLVVGGSSGIGEATALAFAQSGAEVTIASRSQEKLAAAMGRLRDSLACSAPNAGIASHVLDVRDEAGVAKFCEGWGAFDHVVISASQTRGGSVRSLALEHAYEAMNSKFWGAYRVARAVNIRERGSLTFISGFLSVRPGPSVLLGAINAALDALARGMALELAPMKVRVNSVSPGLIATPLWAGLDTAARSAMQQKAATTLPARAMGQASDVANAVLYLAATPYATGSTVLVDGGGSIA